MRLLEGLAELYAVSFQWQETTPAAVDEYAGAILIGFSPKQACAWTTHRIPCLLYSAGATRPLGTEAIRFEHSLEVPAAFRGWSAADPSALVNAPGESDHVFRPLAHAGPIPIWYWSECAGGTCEVVRAVLPALKPCDYLHSHFCRSSWFALLPLLSFLERLSGWSAPPQMAALMLDDPNLHWPTYGYVDFRELARRARAKRYHVAVATVPLDQWYVHRAARAVFLEYPAQLSLLVHGNDHKREELKRTCDAPALAVEALRRVNAMEARTGLTVDRIMAAPHGACSDTMASALRQAGFESACISRGSMMIHNAHVRWPAATGLLPADLLGDGLPVVPRFPLGAASHIDVRCAAFLGQALVMVGHHEDLKAGADVFDDIAARCDAVAAPRWAPLSAIARSRHRVRRRGTTLDVLMYSNEIELSLPDGIEQVHVVAAERATYEVTGSLAPCDLTTAAATDRWALRLRRTRSDEPGTLAPTRRGPRALALARRALCEARDRVRPLFRV